jgi:hypothetical protein
MYSRHYRSELDALRVGGEEREHRVALGLVRLGAAHDRVLPDVVRDGEVVEPGLLRGTRDLFQRRGAPFRSSGPVEAVELQPELPDTISCSVSHSVLMRPLVWMSM